jgi:2-polyprenyl-3-methyl-5-hydroxy-6-metoxy-1,4-benzoquinol methylase
MKTANSMPIKVHEAPECELCGATGMVLHENLADRLFHAPGVWNLRRCMNERCELFWTDPLPDSADIWKLYQSYWTHGNNSEPDAELSSVGKRRIKRLAARLLFWRREALLSDSRYLNQMPAGRLLDVGCGTGDFLAGMAQIGWDATGIDFDEEAVVSARRHQGIKVFSGSIFDQKFPHDAFDAITLSNVIEHIPSPLEMFIELKRILAPGGRITIVTPNPNSLGHRSFGRCWRGLEPPRHLFLFTPRMLKALAVRAGLTPIASFSAVGAKSGILRTSSELWHRFPRSKPSPNVARLQLQEQIFTLFNLPVGEFSVLLASK